MTGPIEVDGSRPAVSWVTSLPPSWTNAHERLVLLALACDAFDDVSTPGSDNLTQWTGMARSRVWKVLASLLADTASRPALIERVDDQGRPAQRPSGRTPTRYRLRVDIQPSTQGRRLTVHAGETVQGSGRPGNRPGNRPTVVDAPFPSLLWLLHPKTLTRATRHAQMMINEQMISPQSDLQNG